MGFGTAGGPVMSSKTVAKMAAILDFTKFQTYQENAEIANIFRRVIKHDTIKHFSAFGSVL